MEELAREAVLQAIASFDDRGPEEFFGHYGVTRDRSYFIRHNGQEYDMKAVIRVALGPVLGLPAFRSKLLNSVKVRQTLKNDLGFDVIHQRRH